MLLVCVRVVLVAAPPCPDAAVAHRHKPECVASDIRGTHKVIHGTIPVIDVSLVAMAVKSCRRKGRETNMNVSNDMYMTTVFMCRVVRSWLNTTDVSPAPVSIYHRY